MATPHWRRPASLEIGICACAVDEVYGPMTATTVGSATNAVMSRAPCWGLGIPAIALSSGTSSRVMPGIAAASSASCALSRPGIVTEAAAPESGALKPMRSVTDSAPATGRSEAAARTSAAPPAAAAERAGTRRGVRKRPTPLIPRSRP
ncbi:MAG: hypothetical protein ACKOTZ_09795 [Chloroflexota bacterium]